jgi:LysR family transcriptional regulator for bpeEF and oprC
VKTPRVSPRVRVFVDWLAELFDDASPVNRDLSRVRQLLGGLQAA